MQNIDFNVNECVGQLIEILHPAELRRLTLKLLNYKNNKLCGHVSPQIVFFKGGVRRVDYESKETGVSQK